MFEETVNGTFTEIINHFSKKEVKGEIVIIVEGAGSIVKGDTQEDSD